MIQRYRIIPNIRPGLMGIPRQFFGGLYSLVAGIVFREHFVLVSAYAKLQCLLIHKYNMYIVGKKELLRI